MKLSKAVKELKGFHYEVLNELGEGTYGLVVKARYVTPRGHGPVSAIKIISKENTNTQHWLQASEEFKAMLMLDGHPSILKLENTFETPSYAYFVLEFCPKGDLLQYVQAHKGVPEAEARVIFKQIAEGIKYAHEEGWVHRDLKLENFLIATDGTIRIADWGFATVYGDGLLTESCGSAHYSSPEICSGKPYFGPEVDVWSLGVTLYALVSALMPFYGTPTQIIQQILRGKYTLPEDFSPHLKTLITGMLHLNPRKRFSIDAVLSHPWFQEKVPHSSSRSSLLSSDDSMKVGKSQEIRREDIIASAKLNPPPVAELLKPTEQPQAAHRPQAIDPRKRTALALVQPIRRKSIVELTMDMMVNPPQTPRTLNPDLHPDDPHKKVPLGTKIRGFVRSLLQRPGATSAPALKMNKGSFGDVVKKPTPNSSPLTGIPTLCLNNLPVETTVDFPPVVTVQRSQSFLGVMPETTRGNALERGRSGSM